MIKTLNELKQFEDKCLFPTPRPLVAPRPAAPAPYQPRPAEPEDPIVTVIMPSLADQNKTLIKLIASTMNPENSRLFKDEHQKYFNSNVELKNLTFVEFKKIKPNDTNDPSYEAKLSLMINLAKYLYIYIRCLQTLMPEEDFGELDNIKPFDLIFFS